MARSIAYRRAQQNRMIAKAKQSRTATKYEGGKTGYYKRLSNDMAQCSCWRCTAHKRRPTRELPITEMKSDVSARQQLEELL